MTTNMELLKEGVVIEPPNGSWEQITGSNFYRAYWQELANEQSIQIMDAPLSINGRKRKIETLGWQMLDHGFTTLHEEKLTNEEMFVTTGRILMGTVYEKGGVDTVEAKGFVHEEELLRTVFSLAVLEGLGGLEHLALRALGHNSLPETTRLVTKCGSSHQTMSVGRSYFLVVKHRALI